MKLQGGDLTGITDVAHTTEALLWKLRRADLGFFRGLLGRLLRKTLLERRGLQEIWLLAKDHLQTRERFIPICRKSNDGGRRCVWLNKELLPKLQHKKEACGR